VRNQDRRYPPGRARTGPVLQRVNIGLNFARLSVVLPSPAVDVPRR
jgi:hypothetical protein